ncbi:MAG: hypothetical protein GSR80_001648 [Desulfurococcales archaeon]|nr:hypothetical protein [Desulfurococcales archaeon]
MEAGGEAFQRFLDEFFYARRRLVEKLARAKSFDEVGCELIEAATLLSPMLATCGPAGPNVAPFMVTFMVRPQYLGEALEELRALESKYWGRGREALGAATEFLLEYVYNIEKVDPLTLASHIMSKGHTWVNLKATREASLGILLPPDRGAYELRVDVEIYDGGEIYEYVNRVHDLMHAVPEGHRSHPWYPAVVMRVREIYDNSYKALGKRIYP